MTAPTGSGPPSDVHAGRRVVEPGGVLLHVGVPKTGTTAVQFALAAARPALASVGVRYPGSGHSQLSALRTPLGWPASPAEAAVDDRRWRALRREVTSAREGMERVVVSAESLAVASTERAADLVDAIGGAAHAEVVVTLRPLVQVLPSAYQEDVKAGEQLAWPVWLDRVCEGPGVDRPDHPTFWVVHDHASVVERWASVVGADHVTVVVVDRRDRHGIFRVFERLIGLPDSTLVPTPVGGNRSMTAAECEVLVRLNARCANRGTSERRRRDVPLPAIWHLLDNRVPPADEPLLSVGPTARSRIRPVAHDIVERIRSSGVRVVGDLDGLLDGLLDDESSAAGFDDPLPIDTVPLDAAVLLLQGMLLLDDPR